MTNNTVIVTCAVGADGQLLDVKLLLCLHRGSILVFGGFESPRHVHELSRILPRHTVTVPSHCDRQLASVNHLIKSVD